MRPGPYKILIALMLILFACGDVPVKSFYLLNYRPDPVKERVADEEYPVNVRVRDFSIERAYATTDIVYRQSPYELKYYSYKSWAVKPERMVTDLLFDHLSKSGIVEQTSKRYDESGEPDYEIRGHIKALEEYDSDELWFAHISLTISLIRISDKKVILNKRYDHRKRVIEKIPSNVIRDLSYLLDNIFSEFLKEVDGALYAELYSDE